MQNNNYSVSLINGEKFLIPKKDDKKKITDFLANHKGKKVVVVQGLGFVGAVMTLICSNALTEEYAVIGVDLADKNNFWKIKPPKNYLDTKFQRNFISLTSKTGAISNISMAKLLGLPKADQELIQGTANMMSAFDFKVAGDHSDIKAMMKDFPNYTSPFWNMKQSPNKDVAKKVDVIISGMETIGSAERSCDIEQMRESFKTISDGEYAQLIYDHFGKDRVDAEMDTFLSNRFITRSGGGIGVTRLISSMIKEGLI